MAADRESSFVLRFDADGGTVRTVLSALKSQIRSDVNELESITSKVELFKGLEAKLAGTEAAGHKAAQAISSSGSRRSPVLPCGRQLPCRQASPPDP